MNQINYNTKQRKFKQLNNENRIQIQTLLNEGYSQTKIAKILGFNQSTISREIKRGSFNKTVDNYFKRYEIPTYEAKTAILRANDRNKNSRKKPILFKCLEFIKIATKMIKKGFSIEIAVGRTKLLNKELKQNIFTPCVTTMYNYLHKGMLKKYGLTLWDLPKAVIGAKKHQRPIAKRDCKGNSIHLRPEGANNRSEPFHWEIDLIVGPKNQGSVLLTMTERKYRLELAYKIKNKESKNVTNVLNLIETSIGLDNFKKYFKSITSDNGSEFLTFKDNMKSCTISDETRTTQYYADPYSSFQRGSNEAMNGCIRKFFPKKTNFDIIENDEIEKTIKFLNNKPKKCLGFRTSLEAVLLDDSNFLSIYKNLKKIVAFN